MTKPTQIFRNLKPYVLAIVSCALITSLGIVFLVKANPGPTTIGQDISTTNLSVSGNITSGVWQGTVVGTQYGGTGQNWSATTKGSIPYFSIDGTMSAFSGGTAGQFLKSQGTEANPAWTNVARTATFVVAANDSATLSKQQADYICDGTADDVQIQQAIDALPADGGKVILMEGIYNIAQTIKPLSHQHLQGQGFSTVLKGTASINSTTIEIRDKNNVIVSDLQINGILGADFSNDGINSVTSNNIIIEKCYVQNQDADAVDIDGGYRILVDNCIFYNNGGCGVHVSQYTPKYITVSNCISMDNGAKYSREGFDIYDGSEVASLPPASHVTFANCISINDYYGIRLCGEYNKAIGCNIYNSTKDAIRITSTYYNSTNCKVIGCSIATAGDNGITVNGSQHTISSNSIKDTVSSGLEIFGSNHTITSNVIDSAGSCSIETDSSANDLIISNNEISNCFSGIACRGTRYVVSANNVVGGIYGIYVSGDYHLVEANQIRSASDALYGCIWVKGDYSIISNNMLSDGTGAGLYLETGNYANVIGNNIYANAKKGILVESSSDNICIKNNKVLDNTEDGIMVTGVSNGIFVGNEVNNNTWRGFDCVSLTNSIVEANQILNNGTWGLKFDSSCINNIVKNNQMLNNPTGGFSEAGSGHIIYEKYSDLFMDVLAASTNAVHAAITGTGVEQEIATAITNPDVSRNISITTTNNDSPSGTVTITGVDAQGNSTTGDITISAGGTAYGGPAFATVSKITIPAGVGVTDTVSVGFSDKLGLSNIIYVSGDVYKVKKNNADYPAANYTVNTTYDTVDVSTGGAITGGDDFTIYYKSNLNIIE